MNQDSLYLYKTVKNTHIKDINKLIEHDQWEQIATCFPLISHIMNTGLFNHIENIPHYMFNSYSLCLSIFKNDFKPTCLDLIPERYLDNIEFIIEALDINYLHIKTIPEKYWNKKIVIEWFCNKYALQEPLQFLPSNYQDDVLLNTILIQEHYINYKYLSPTLKNNIEIYHNVVNKDTLTFIYVLAGDNIRNSEKDTIDVLKVNAALYPYIGNTLKDNVTFFLKLIDENCNVMQYASNNIKDNEQCIWESFKRFPDSLEFASERLLNNTSFFLQLIKEVDFSLPTSYFNYWGNNIRNDIVTIKEILPILSLTQNLSFISESLRGDYNFMLQIVAIDSSIMAIIENPIKCNSQFFIEAYNLLDEQCHGEYRYDLNGPQTRIFSYINSQAINNEEFLLALYNEFKTMFLTVILPQVKHLNGDLIDILNDLNQETDHMSHFMEKLKLKHNLQKNLAHHAKHKLLKI